MSATTDVARVNQFLYAISELSKDFTMPSQQQMLLLALYVHGTLNQQDLTNHTGVARSSNSRNIAKLGIGIPILGKKGPGYVESFEDQFDRRQKLVRLTSAGRELVEQAWQRVYHSSSK